MKQGKEVKPNVPSIELAPKYTDVRQKRELKKTQCCAHSVRKRAHRFSLVATLETLMLLPDVWKVKVVKTRRKNWGRSVWKVNCQVHF